MLRGEGAGRFRGVSPRLGGGLIQQPRRDRCMCGLGLGYRVPPVLSRAAPHGAGAHPVFIVLFW